MKHSSEFLSAMDALQRGTIEIEYIAKSVQLDRMVRYTKPAPPRLTFAGIDPQVFHEHIMEVIRQVDAKDKQIAELQAKLASINLISRTPA